jgi:hypothetical protein
MAFCRRQCKTPWPQTQADADALIEPLQAMAMRHVKPAEISARVSALAGHPALNAWQVGFIADLQRQFNQAEDPRSVVTPHKLAKLIEAEARCQQA